MHTRTQACMPNAALTDPRSAGLSPPMPLWCTAQGGGWCYNEQDCLARSQTAIGSSASWPGAGVPLMDGGAHGVLSSDPRENPDFHNWTMCAGPLLAHRCAGSLLVLAGPCSVCWPPRRC